MASTRARARAEPGEPPASCSTIVSRGHAAREERLERRAAADGEGRVDARSGREGSRTWSRHRPRWSASSASSIATGSSSWRARVAATMRGRTSSCQARHDPPPSAEWRGSRRRRPRDWRGPRRRRIAARSTSSRSPLPTAVGRQRGRNARCSWPTRSPPARETRCTSGTPGTARARVRGTTGPVLALPTSARSCPQHDRSAGVGPQALCRPRALNGAPRAPGSGRQVKHLVDRPRRRRHAHDPKVAGSNPALATN